MGAAPDRKHPASSSTSSFIYYSDLRLHCSHIYLQTNVHSKYAQPIWAYKSLHTLFMNRHETPKQVTQQLKHHVL